MSDVEIFAALSIALLTAGVFVILRLYSAHNQRVDKLEGRVRYLEAWAKREDRRRIHKLELELEAIERKNPASVAHK